MNEKKNQEYLLYDIAFLKLTTFNSDFSPIGVWICARIPVLEFRCSNFPEFLTILFYFIVYSFNYEQ